MKAGTRFDPAPRIAKTTRPRPKRSEPHSTWQIMVDDRMRELGITSRALVDKISPPKRKFAHTTIWAWTRNLEGTPPTATYTEEVNRKLAVALELKPERLAHAFEESRRHLVMTDKDAAARGKLSVLRQLFSTSTKKTWKSSEVVKLIDDIAGN